MPKVASTKAALAKALKKNIERQSAQSTFDREYAKLNDAQKHAVETIEGPVMVVAGPGTGKTQVVAMRVANILSRTQMRPSNILCLTFSVSGATAMRDRLRTLIGSSAYGVTVSTIHAFCHTQIEQHPSLFSEWEARKQLTDLEQHRELNNIIDQISSHSVLINPKDPHARNAEILGRISQVKREGKTLDDLHRSADLFDRQMEEANRKGTKIHERNLRQAKKFRDFILLFERYQNMLERTERYDFDDMILFFLQALSEHEQLLASLQERYQYILVDEAQDLNGAQWNVIERLTTYEIVSHEPNFFLVGDDDQSIYRFQGGNMQHMVAFHRRFPRAPVIPLTVTYRLPQEILTAAEKLIEHNEERLTGLIPGLEKHLQSAAPLEGLSPVLLRAASDAAEPWLVADLVEERLNREIPPEEIAVMSVTNRELFSLFDVFRARSIPVVLRGKADLLNHSLVRQALAILGSLGSLHLDRRFSSALACDCFGCHPADLARASEKARAEKRSLLSVLLSDAEHMQLTNRPSLLRARDIIIDLDQKCSHRTVLETVEHGLRESGLTERASSDPLDLAVVEAFFQHVKNWCFDRPGGTFEQFLDDLTFYADPQYGQVRLTYELPHLVSHGVQLLTAHQSKGLEFQTVILTNFRDGHWDERREIGTIPFPEDLLYGWESAQKRFEKHQDERRLAYVAMTRARRELLFTCPKEIVLGTKSRPVTPSAFFAEAGPLPEEDRALKTPVEASLLLLQPKRELDSELQAYIRTRLETFSLSPTSLSRFLADPQKFLLIDLLLQPEAFDEGTARALGYGSAAHFALKQWGIAMQKGEDFDSEKLIEHFRWHLTERTILTVSQRADLLALGSTALPTYMAERLAKPPSFIHAIEREYVARLEDTSASLPAGIPLKGKIDRIDLASPVSAIATVIDYKTGRAKTEREIRGGLESGIVSRTEEGDTFRQLTFYAILLELAEPFLKPETFVLEFLGERGEDPVSRAFSIVDSEKTDLRKLIREVWGKILALDFTPL